MWNSSLSWLIHINALVRRLRQAISNFGRVSAMIKTILVPLTGSATDAAACSAAVSVARLLGAHLDFLHVRMDPGEAAAAFASDVAGGMVSVGLMESLEAEAKQREERAQKSFRDLCEREKLRVGGTSSAADAVSAEWHREVGNEAAWIGEYGRTSDLRVVGRPANEQGATRDTMEAALLDTGRPLLIPGSAPPLAETVAIAWKSTREAARAVTAAAPFLAKAKRIVILTVAEDDRMDRESGARLFATVQRHKPATEARHFPLRKRSPCARLR